MSVQDAYGAACADRMGGNRCPAEGCGARIGRGFWWCDACESLVRGTAAWTDLMAVLDLQAADMGRDLAAERAAAKAGVTAEVNARRRPLA